MLGEAGFHDLRVEGDYTGRPATADDGSVVFIARTQGVEQGRGRSEGRLPSSDRWSRH